MIRRLFMLASAISLLLFIATVLLWRQAYRVPIRYGRTSYQPTSAIYGQDWLDNTRGVISTGYIRETLTDSNMMTSCAQREKDGKFGPLKLSWIPTPVPQNQLERVGLFFHAEHTPRWGGRNTSAYWIGIADWLLLTLTGILPALWTVYTIRRITRKRTGLCPTCAYNLTGNTSGICPECGRLLPTTSPADPAKT